MKPTAIFVAILILISAGAVWLGALRSVTTPKEAPVASFEECVALGYAVMESYPRQCRDQDGNLFTEAVEASWETAYVNATDDLIRGISVSAGDRVSSPLTVTGEARGFWFFEASFPVVLVDWDGRIIAEHYATAEGEWMTEEFVPFSFTLEFDTPPGPGGPINRGALILQRDNPSGLPENDAAVEIPIIFE